MTASLKNWSGNYTYGTQNLHTPYTVEQLQNLVLQYPKIKCLGSRHSFNGIADSTENLISLQHLNRIVSLDQERMTVTVEAGIRYGELCKVLNREGFALHNLASLPHISVAGAVATATHGSGVRNGNLATAVSAMEIVTALGEKICLSREHDKEVFEGMVVGLGGLGVVSQLTLDLLPTFTMKQTVYENLSMTQLRANFDEIMSSAYSVSLFTHWQNENFTQVWIKSLVEENPHETASVEATSEWFGATLSTRPRHPLPDMSAENCTEQGGVPGAWFERLPHFRMEFTPSRGEELQSEYLLPRAHALSALEAIQQIGEQIAPLLLVSEVRTVAADTLWMSPCYKQDCIGIHFTWKPKWDAVKKVLPLIEAQLEPFDARPHWGKLFTMSPSRIQSLYPKLPDFRRLLEEYDPQGKFRNEFLETYLGEKC